MISEQLLAYVGQKVDEANQRHQNHKPDIVLKSNHDSERIAKLIDELGKQSCTPPTDSSIK